MRTEQILEELESAAGKLGVRVSYDALGGDALGQGGLCRVKGEWRVIIDRNAAPGDKITVLAQALVRFDLERVFLSPEVREIVQRYSASAS